MIKYIINDLKLASKEEWVYLVVSFPVSLVALADWFIFQGDNNGESRI